MTEILPFPKNKIVREIIPDCEDLLRIREKNKKKFADTLTEDISEELLGTMAELGIDIESKHFVKDFHLLVGILAATIYRSLDMEHDLHQFIDESVTVVNVIMDDDKIDVKVDLE
jgi:hypothetical protein